MSGKSIIGENKGKKGIGGQIASFFKKETVLCLAAAVAGVSMFFVPPDRAWNIRIFGYWHCCFA